MKQNPAALRPPIGTLSILPSFPAALSALVGLGVVFMPTVVEARSLGLTATTCSGCHGGTETADLSVRLEPESVQPGETMQFVIDVSGANVVEAGIAVLGPGVGTWTIPQGQPLTVSGDWVTHNQPKPVANGVVEFLLNWTAPEDVGVAHFEIVVLGSNGDGRTSGDRAAAESVTFGYGCEPVTVYWDSDDDGFGRTDAWMVTCDDEPAYVDVPGDCGDSDPLRYPGAPERCNGLDDDCDGEVDEDVETLTYYPDRDGDGYGNPSGGVETCTPDDGYVDNALDCNDTSLDINPEAIETCDYADNNCDGRIDEGLRPTCGVGLCARVSDLCGSNLMCSPGEPLVEQCNGLDDDCDGETDEEGCPAGQTCQDRQCVDVGAGPAPTTVAPAGPSTSAPSVDPVVPTPVSPSTGPVETPAPIAPSPSTTVNETSAPVAPGESAGSASGACSVGPASRPSAPGGGFVAFPLLAFVLSCWRRRSRRLARATRAIE